MHEIDTVRRTPPGQATVSLRGESGVLHGFTAFPLNEAPCGPAVYIFAQPVADINRRIAFGWSFLGVGENGDMRHRTGARYARIIDGLALGATQLLLHFCYHDAGQRRLIPEDLAGALKLGPRPRLVPPRAA